jgi:hypothetical protein
MTEKIEQASAGVASELNAELGLIDEVIKLRDKFKARYKSLNCLKGNCARARAKAAKRSYLDLNAVIKKHTGE